MAKIIFGAGIANIRGSMAGTVFSANANGAYIRNRATPTNNNTISQQLSRGRFAAAAIFWRSLTLAQQNSFRDQAINYPYVDAIGQSKTYTGNQLCMVVNNRLLSVDAETIEFMIAPVSVPPIGEIAGIMQKAINNFVATFQFETGVLVVPANCKLIIECTPSLSKGVTNPKAEAFRRIAVLDAADSTDEVPLASSYNAVFGVIPDAGSNIYLKATVISTETGQYSPSLDFKVPVAA